MSETTRHDPVGCVDELREAFAHPSLSEFETTAEPSADAAYAAFCLARALGYCRLYGVAAGELDGTLPAAEARAAAEHLVGYLASAIRDADELPTRWDDAEQLEGDDLCAELLEARMDAWAVGIALGEALEDATAEAEPEAEALGLAVDRVLEAAQAFDEASRRPDQAALLSTLVHTELLNNWRALLTEEFQSPMPWWLDGSLEEVDRRIEAIGRKAMPGMEAWGRLREASRRHLPRRHPAGAIIGIPISVALAAAAVDDHALFAAVLKWESPEGDRFAALACPSQAAPGATVAVTFHNREGAPATELDGVAVWLSGEEAAIDSQGRVFFELQRLQESLQASGQPLILEVKARGTPWPAMEND